ncbi:MAG: A/G-specific adenine glycosylase [Betaproteobacteria bacterium]|nr:A/G-specific adenine glycosylase [Betaproteobacteria bacterium]
MTTPSFAHRIIAWQQVSGRHDLPWQGTRDAYRIWLSEIMLQQTQVATVIPYYQRFLARFPTILALADAADDEVMQLWAGLGYYARARNLLRAARAVVALHGGVFPREFAAIQALPGIGRSTAAAIAAFAYGESRAILDGNVKRVFARHFGVGGDISSKTVQDRLWAIAESALPSSHIEAYTQGLMDLGATLCARSKPACLLCPVQASCVAHGEGRVSELPGQRIRRERPHKTTQMLVLLAEGEVLLEKRPATGIWGGLWSLPEVMVGESGAAVARARLGVEGKRPRKLAVVEHGFTHYALSIVPVLIEVTARPMPAMPATAPGLKWVALDAAADAGVPAPVKRILRSLINGHL